MLESIEAPELDAASRVVTTQLQLECLAKSWQDAKGDESIEQ